MKLGERVHEGEPLGDAELEAAFLFELFVDEEVLPVAEVLHAGDAVGEGVGDGELVALAALGGGGRRNEGVDEGSCADSRRMPVGWPWASRSMAPPCGGTVLPVMPAAASAAELAMAMWPSMRSKECGMAGGDFVEILAGGEDLGGP